jgi:hypothetical protein
MDQEEMNENQSENPTKISLSDEVDVKITEPVSSEVKVIGKVSLSSSNVIRDLLLLIIAAALVIIAIPAFHNFRLTLQANEDARLVALAANKENKPSESDNNVTQAKNTLHQHGIVGILIDNFQSNSEWSFFISNTGVYIVDAEGRVPNTSQFLTITKESERISYSDRISELDDLNAQEVEKIDFRIQFKKQLGVDFSTEYDHYSNSFTELTVTMKDKTVKSIYPGQNFLDYIEAYLQESIK